MLVIMNFLNVHTPQLFMATCTLSTIHGNLHTLDNYIVEKRFPMVHAGSHDTLLGSTKSDLLEFISSLLMDELTLTVSLKNKEWTWKGGK